MSDRELNSSRPHLTRRRVLRGLGTGLVAAPIAHLLACVSEEQGIFLGSDTSTGTGDGTGDDTGTSDTGTDTDTGDDCGVDPGSWATGGTAAMVAKACYPDPFADAEGTCALICETTEGPCTADTLVREDVSEGWGGLPVRLALRLVYADTCEPVVGASVEIWHTQRTGVYSGVTPSGAFCYGDDPEAETYLYFRGTQVSDDDGRVNFDTCYPGWYSGRAIHIHFRVYLDGDLHATSQLFFSDAMSQTIFAEHPDYAEFGQPDTVNTTDNIIGGEDDLSPYVLETARMVDGAMLAWKQVAIRSSLDAETCSAGGMMGGPPP